MNNLTFNNGAYKLDLANGEVYEGVVSNLIAHFLTDTITITDRVTLVKLPIITAQSNNLQIGGQTKTFEQIKTIIETELAKGGASTADAVSYDNSKSGFSADNVQSALDEVGANLGEISPKVDSLMDRADLVSVQAQNVGYSGIVDGATNAKDAIDKIAQGYKPKLSKTILTNYQSRTRYSGEIGEQLTISTYNYRRGWYITNLKKGRYAVYGVTSNAFIVDSNNIILQKTEVAIDNKKLWRFDLTSDGVSLYVTGYDGFAPVLYEVNDNKFLLRKGEKANTSYSATTIETSLCYLGEKARKISLSGSGSFRMTSSEQENFLGVWFTISNFEKLKNTNNSFVLNFCANDDTKLSEFVLSSAENPCDSYFNVNKWMYLQYNAKDNNKKCSYAEFVYNLADNVDLIFYPYLIKDCIVMPAVVYNLEHWSDGYNKVSSLLSYVDKVTMTGGIPTSESDISFVNQKSKEKIIDYGIYGNELNDGANSLLDQATIPNAFDYCHDRIVAHYAVTDKVVSFGQGGHNNTPKSTYIAENCGIKVFRSYLGYSNFPLLESKDDRICLACTHTNTNTDIVGGLGTIFMFSHTTDFTINQTRLTNLKNLIANNSLRAFTMRDFYEMRDELVIGNYD